MADGERLRMLVGRDGEVAILDAAIADVRSGRSAVLVVRGEAGIGKTTLVEHVVGSATDVEILRVTGIESEIELPYAALHRLLLPLIPRIETLPKPRRVALATIFGLLPGEAPSEFLIGLATLTLLAEAARDRPLLCVIDDAQWLDRASVGMMTFVGRRLLADKVGMFFCVREKRTDDLDFEGLPELRLHGLADADALTVLTDRAGGAVDPHVARRITAEAGGNPLALTEFVHQSTPEELRGDQLTSRSLPLSSRIEAHYLHRIRALPQAVQMVLLLASAESSGDPMLLWRATAALGMGDDELRDVENAIGDFLVVRPHVVFRHALVRSAVYSGASTPLRRQVHRALAGVTDEFADPDRWAWHLAAGADGPDEAIAVHLERSAGRAGARGGHSAEATFLSKAAELTPDPHARGVRLLFASWAALAAGDYRRCLALVAQAESLLVGRGWQAQAARVRGAALSPLGRPDEAPAVLVASAEDLEEFDVALARDTWTCALSSGWLGLGRIRDLTLRDMATSMLAAPSTLDDKSATYGDGLRTGIAVRIAVGYTEAVPVLRQAIATMNAVQQDRDQLKLEPVLMLLVAHELWDLDSGRRWLEGMAERERDHGVLIHLWQCLHSLAYIERSAGRLASARAYCLEAQGISRAIGLGPLVAFPGEAADLLWRPEADVNEVVARLGEIIDQSLLGASATACRLALAIQGLAEGRYRDAYVHAQAVYDEDAPAFGNQILPELVEAAVRTGDTHLADAALQRLMVRALASGSDWARGLLSRSQALLAKDGAAESHYANAIALLDKDRLPLDHARACLLYGEWLRRQKRRADSVEQLRHASEMFTSIGAEGFAERANIELRAVGAAPVRRHSTEQHRGLTAQEEQVSRLAAHGMTNREIATTLFISESTAAYHLKKVFRKLDVSSRRELARRGFDTVDSRDRLSS
jgi:DNA-binding CsgD family transcriptional regulator